MKIKPWIKPSEQIARLGNENWSVPRLIQLSSGLQVFDAPIDFISTLHFYERLSLKQLVMHAQAIQDADLSFPIILDEHGEILDGRHRMMKAIMLGHKTIKAVRFEENPTPDRIE